jgi:CRP-like cAMP-binding protein
MYEDITNLGKADTFVEEILEIIDNIKLLDHFSVDEIKLLCRHMQCFAAPRNYKLIQEGDIGDYLILVLSGSVEVYKNIPNVGNKKIAEVTAGVTLGEMSLIDSQTRFASCITLLPTDFAVFTRESMNEVLIEMPRLGNKFLLVLLQLMAQRLRDTCDRFLPSVFGVPI